MKHRNTQERARMLIMRRVEQNFRVGSPGLAPHYQQPRASIPGGIRRAMARIARLDQLITKVLRDA